MVGIKELMSFSNAVVVAMGEAMLNMGISIPLAWTQMANAFQETAKVLLKETGIEFDGNDVPSILKGAGEALKSTGLIQRFKVLEASDNGYKLDMGECIFAPATMLFQKIAGGDPNFIPPCPMNAIIYSVIQEKLGKSCTISACKFVPEENTRIFTVEVA